jgi:hypothetical protein
MIDTVAVLASMDVAPFIFSTKVVYLRDVDRYVAGPLAEPGRVALYDSSGVFQRLLLQRGAGPGELESVDLLAAGNGDTVIVYGGSRKLLKLSTSSGRVHEFLVPALSPYAMIETPDGETVINSRSRLTPSIAVFDSAMNALAVFGDRLNSGAARNDLGPRGLQLRLATDRGRTIWTLTSRYRLKIDRWTVDGRHLRSLERTAHWFDPYSPEDEPEELWLPSQAPILPFGLGLFQSLLRTR